MDRPIAIGSSLQQRTRRGSPGRINRRPTRRARHFGCAISHRIARSPLTLFRAAVQSRTSTGRHSTPRGGLASRPSSLFPPLSFMAPFHLLGFTQSKKRYRHMLPSETTVSTRWLKASVPVPPQRTESLTSRHAMGSRYWWSSPVMAPPGTLRHEYPSFLSLFWQNCSSQSAHVLVQLNTITAEPACEPTAEPERSWRSANLKKPISRRPDCPHVQVDTTW
jgi:hypothetical protein